MKFGKQLEHYAKPEWVDFYVNYKRLKSELERRFERRKDELKRSKRGGLPPSAPSAVKKKKRVSDSLLFALLWFAAPFRSPLPSLTNLKQRAHCNRPTPERPSPSSTLPSPTAPRPTTLGGDGEGERVLADAAGLRGVADR